jgi:hypothetical protein
MITQSACAEPISNISIHAPISLRFQKCEGELRENFFQQSLRRAGIMGPTRMVIRGFSFDPEMCGSSLPRQAAWVVTIKEVNTP